MTWIDLTNIIMSAGGVTISFLGSFLTWTTSYMKKDIRRFFRVLFLILSLYIISDLVCQCLMFSQDSDYATLSRIFMFLESLLSSLLLPMLTYLLFRSAGMEPGKARSYHIALVLLLIYVILLISTQFSGKMYYISDQNVYHRGELYPLLLVPPVLIMLLNMIILFHLKKKLTRKEILAFTAYLAIPFVCMLVQMWFYGLILTAISTTISAMFMFLFILSDQIEHTIRQQRENLEAQANIRILQMRPHFIYNTMTSIYYLCEQDPKKAMQTISDFTDYLRNNFSAMAKKDTIPFREELSHVRAYLSIEQTRFADRLFVEYDTPHISFRIPPLTLQPIVENSVKHGVDPELSPLTIRISTRETPEGSEIVITDDGMGMECKQPGDIQDEKDPHIALNNIRARLDMMCGGTISVSPGETCGTVVRIFIPYPPKKHMTNIMDDAKVN